MNRFSVEKNIASSHFGCLQVKPFILNKIISIFNIKM